MAEIEKISEKILDRAKKTIKSVFETLYAVDATKKVKEKDGLRYLSWASAWAEVKKEYPDATYDIWKDPETHRPYVFDPETGYVVYASVTINGLTHEMCLPVMDTSNKAMKNKPYTYKVKNKNFKYATFDEEKGFHVDKFGKKQDEYLDKTVEAATMFEINKAIMRCLTKACAMHGLSLHIYEGEDIPEDSAKTIELTDEIDALVKKKAALSDKAKNKVAELCKEAERKAFPELGEDLITGYQYKNIEDIDILNNLKRQLLAVRK